MVFCVLILLVYQMFSRINSHIFNTESVTIISLDGVADGYFGYSLWLQRGDQSIVTIGAPKSRDSHGIKYGGEVFQCKVDRNSWCKSAFPSYLHSSPNGDFMGGTVNGEDHVDGIIMACSPRSSVQFEFKSSAYLYGKCIFKKDSLDAYPYPNFYNVSVERIEGAGPMKWNEETRTLYYEYGYAQIGFDVSFYDKDNVFCGAPGLNTTGGALIFPVTEFEKPVRNHEVTILPKRVSPDLSEEDDYIGYSLNTAFNEQTKETWFIIGAPRAENLFGKATLFKYVETAEFGMDIIEVFTGDQFGAYFGGSVLLIDLNNDRVLDVLVGAPSTSTKKLYDEGCVHIFISSIFGYLPRKTISGSNKLGSRFGISVVSLGDFDLDGFNDFAVSAPYEDEGKGAVYIYNGCSDGIGDSFSQRLTASLFANFITFTERTRGFGMGLSRGNDIDKNGHNDIAIGAYKSDQVFIVRSYGILDYVSTITPSVDVILENTTEFTLQICLTYTKRSDLVDVPWMIFSININLDYRAVQNKIDEIVTVNLMENRCQIYLVQIRAKEKFYPFSMNSLVIPNATNENVKILGNSKLEVNLPFAIGCTNNNFCLTALTLQIKAKRQKLILGEDYQIDLEVTIRNDGDPAYQGELQLQVSASIELRNNCDKNKDGNYTCPIGYKLETNATKNETYIFDILKLDLNSKEISINVSIRSYGINKKGYKDKDNLMIPVTANSTSYIIGNTIPENMALARVPEPNNTHILHRFTVGKIGPSPLKLNIYILVPLVDYLGENIFNVKLINGSIDGVPVKCTPGIIQITMSHEDIFNKLNVGKIPTNRSIAIHCDGVHKCLQYHCEGILENSNQKAVFEIRLLLISNLLVKKYSYELGPRNLIAYLPVAVQQNSTNSDHRVLELAPFVIFVQDLKFVPLWIFVLGTFIGFILLIFLVIALYRCSFFKREYKDYLDQEYSKTLAENRYCCDVDENPCSIGKGNTKAVENDYVELMSLY
ncbi:unnamed protein product [Ceutorhynchus assimilis]|uniref:Integrin alpha second immunoglobulin-like domain-containing protein n=1 Tax=Ceutorhynchus assimilis TaxID=467358 RepID=A0A9N9MNV6_9CUCU|nr:unnamed protein product [Ceutorhynchus assimilis]